jgi:hypothetical protein
LPTVIWRVFLRAVTTSFSHQPSGWVMSK